MKIPSMRGWHWPLVMALAGLFVLTAPARADDKVVSPEDIPGTIKVDAEGVIGLVEKVPGLVIVDSRIRQDRLQGYIEDSLSLPDVETDCQSLARLVPGKSTPVLFYCNGPKCGRSVHASRKALGCGYQRVYWFRGGFEEWTRKNYPYVKK